ncbi:hypothetical protein [Chryseobacterium sp. c4a]|uniref:hypothetical protein n=1 Tax=Chryseobacterium sp. c4a TaxID=1573582 RepID=UPI00135A3505|nr:hypothetical protein [Chryseobacterium sp. c4a]
MRNLKITDPYLFPRMEINDIFVNIMGSQSVAFQNERNGACFFFSRKEEELQGEIIYYHLVNGKQNVFCTNGFRFSFQGKTYELNAPGDSVNVEDGSIVVCLKYSYMLELLQNSFYAESQEKVYDFIKEEFLILLS